MITSHSKNALNVRAVDVGKGRVKLTTSIEGICTSFPSIVDSTIHPYSRTLEQLIDGRMLDVVSTTTAGVHHTEITPEYRALLYKALDKMRVKQLDLLVTGLPPHRYAAHRRALTQILKGTHAIRSDASITIEEVRVVPQPLGGLIAYLHERRIDWKRQMNRRYLVVDVGYGSCNWLCTHGLTEVPARSGGVTVGMSHYLSRANSIVDRLLGRHYPFRHKIDEGLRRGRFRVGKREIDVDLLCIPAEDVAGPAVEALYKGIGGPQGIDEVIVVGGGSEYFMPVLMSSLPELELHTVAHPMYANVRGFHLIGEILGTVDRDLLLAQWSDHGQSTS